MIFMYVGREVECREEVLEGVLSLPPKGPTCVHTESATGGTHITHSQHFKDELTGDCYRQGERCCWCAGRLAQGIVILVLNNLKTLDVDNRRSRFYNWATDTQTHTQTHTHRHRHTDTHTHTHTDTYTHRNTHTHRHTQTQTHTHTDTDTHTQTRTHTRTQTHTYMDTYIHICIPLQLHLGK